MAVSFAHIYNMHQYSVRFRRGPILPRNTETALSGGALSGVLLYVCIAWGLFANTWHFRNPNKIKFTEIKSHLLDGQLTSPPNHSFTIQPQIHTDWYPVIEFIAETYTHTHIYIIGHYNPSVRIIDLVPHTTYVVCVSFIHKSRVLYMSGGSYSLNSLPTTKFWEAFLGNFMYSQSFCQKSAKRKSSKQYFSYIVWMSGLGLEP